MGKGFKCRRDVLEALIKDYNSIVMNDLNGDFLKGLENFNDLAEMKLREILTGFYIEERSRNQAWRSCKGALYEYAVLRYIHYIIDNDKDLSKNLAVLPGDELSPIHKNQIVIRNWNEILPDVDILLIQKATNKVKAIISCKTSLRERLTETAFWKRELEKMNKGNIKLIFITTDKDNELRIDTNRYIILHIIDCTFITDLKKYKELMEYYNRKYGKRNDFFLLLSKVRYISEIQKYLKELIKN